MSARNFKLSELVNPSPKQREFLEAVKTHRFTLFGGAAGGGKSYILRWWLVVFLIAAYRVYGLRGVQVGLFCEDYPTLKDRQISKIDKEFPRWLGSLKETKAEGLRFKLSPDLGGGMILLRNLDDPGKYDSSEFAAIGVEELTKNPKKVFDELRKRLRWVGFPEGFVFPFAAGANPGGIGHAWVKALFILLQMPAELAGREHEFAFIPAKSSDNPHLPKTYYADNLATLPAKMRKAYAEGSWDEFAGQYFDLFSEQRNVIRAELIGIEKWWPKWISMDWGFEHPFCIHWHTRAPDGRVYTYREYSTNHLSEPTIAAEIVARSGGEQIDAFFLSWDAFGPSKKRASQKTIAQEMGEVIAAAVKADRLKDPEDRIGTSLPLPIKADDERIGGWRLMYTMLERQTWWISSACPKLIECLPTLTRDEKKVEDVAKRDGDDPGDCARYGLKSYLAPGEMPAEREWEAKVAEVKSEKPDVDLNTLAMMHRRFDALNRAKAKVHTWR